MRCSAPPRPTSRPTRQFTDLGGDSLSALTFANLLHDIFGVDVPVGVIVSPASDLAAIAAYVEEQRAGGSKRPTYDAVHGRDATEVHASDLTLDKFLDEATLAAAPSLPGPAAEVRTVLLTGATGFLGRYLALEWLERMDLVDGKVIALVRAKDDDVGARPAGRDVRQRRPEAARALPRHWPPSTSRCSPATRARRISAWRRRLAAAGRHRRPDRRPGRPGQPRAALQPAVRAQRRRHRGAHPHRADHPHQAVRLRLDDRRGRRHRAGHASSRRPTSGR